nr:hypothetical protein [Bradyrhizobium cenepequi]
MRGLVAILIPMLLGRPAREIVAADPQVLFACPSISSHSGPNDLRSMVLLMRADAQAALVL